MPEQVTDSKGKKSKEEERIVYVKKTGEITEEDLAKVAGGLPATGHVSKTIVVDPGYTDVDCGF